MKYKAIFSDVDETLITSKEAMPSSAVVEAVRKLKDKAHFGLATAKPFNQVEKICKLLGLSGPSIVSGGAQIVDVASGKYYEEHVIKNEIIYMVHDILKKQKENLNVWVQDNGTDIIFDDKYIPDKPFIIVISKIAEKTADDLINIFSHLPDVFITKTPAYDKSLIDVHISNSHSTKQNGILKSAEILGIKPGEIIGIGDGQNDYPLLMACGLKVAMGNAVPEIKAIADFVTKSVEFDGIAEVIDKYFV